MIATAKAARAAWPCPLSRLWGDKEVNPKCRGDGCPVWRWAPLPAEAPEFKAAVAARLKEIGGGPLKHKEAVAWVMENRAALGLPETPQEGFCGLGNKP